MSESFQKFHLLPSPNPLSFNMKLSQVLIWFGVFMAVTGTAIIDRELQQAYDTGVDGSLENVIITFEASHEIVIEIINTQKYSTIHEKRTALTEAQQEYTNEIQGPLQKFLRRRNVVHESFWINNKMYVPNASSDLVQVIANFPGVAKIEKEYVFTIDPIDVGKVEDFENETIRPEATVEWGIERIHAPKVWSKGFKGKGIVVANIDTGVRHTHEALKAQWREKNGWFDAHGGKKLPYDTHGHGTHTMGTLAGTHGVGVAPEATWIACLGCPHGGCTFAMLTKCGQWIQCPTDHSGKNKDCKLAPDLVSNSWGGSNNNKFYDEVIASWHAAEIIPIFGVGNNGGHCSAHGTSPKCCGSTISPGDRKNVIGVGSIDKNNRVSHFSSLGPAEEKKIKPEVAAPGGHIRSAYLTSDTAYAVMSGTSMATPHVAGVVALMRQKSKHLKYEKVYKAITSTAHHHGLDTGNLPTCGGIKGSTFPNNVYGHGLVCAERAVGAA